MADMESQHSSDTPTRLTRPPRPLHTPGTSPRLNMTRPLHASTTALPMPPARRTQPAPLTPVLAQPLAAQPAPTPETPPAAQVQPSVLTPPPSRTLTTPVTPRRVKVLEPVQSSLPTPPPARVSGTPVTPQATMALVPEQPAPATSISVPAPVRPSRKKSTGDLGAATILPANSPYLMPTVEVAHDPEVWLVAHAMPGGGLHSLEGEGRPGVIRVGRPYGHLRSLRPVLPTSQRKVEAAPETPQLTGKKGHTRNGLGSGVLTVEESLATAKNSAAEDAATRAAKLPAKVSAFDVVSAIEIETDTGVFRVERPGMVLSNSDLAWALAHLEAGEPDSMVPLPRRQLALLLTLLPTPEDPEHPERDPQWGWAHRMKGPWERGPLHPRGRLGRLIAVDPDHSGRGMHRACFEILGGDEVVWAHGVPCYRPGSVYELTPLSAGASLSRWLSWPVAKAPRTRKKTNPPITEDGETPPTKRRAKVASEPASKAELPTWEIARVVYRVGAPRWPLAGVVEPLGPMGTVG